MFDGFLGLMYFATKKKYLLLFLLSSKKKESVRPRYASPLKMVVEFCICIQDSYKSDS